MRHLVWFAVVVLLALTFVPVSDLQAAGDRRTGARKGLAAGTTHSAVRLKATTPGKDAVVFELLVRDLCVIMVKRTELVVPCSEWRPLDKTGPERALLVKGKVDLPDGSTATVFPPKKGILPGGERYVVQASLASHLPGDKFPGGDFTLERTKSGTWSLPAAGLGQALMMHGNNEALASWKFRLHGTVRVPQGPTKGTHTWKDHPLRWWGGSSRDHSKTSRTKSLSDKARARFADGWQCLGLDDWEGGGALSTLHTESARGEAAWRPVFEGLDGAAAACPEIRERAQQAACQAAQAVVPTAEAWTQRMGATQQLVDLFADRCAGGLGHLEEREDGLVYVPNQDTPFTGPAFTMYSALEHLRSEVPLGQSPAAGQEGPTQVNWTRWYQNANKKDEAQLKDGLRHGYYIEWHGNGQMKLTGEYQAAELHGTWTFWNQAGKKQAEVELLDSRLHGTGAEWNLGDQKMWQGEFQAGKLHGLYSKWNPNGGKTEEVSYQGGKKHGSHAHWHENGQKAVEAGFKADELDGLYSEWNDTGIKFLEETFQAGKRNGTSTAWYTNGQKRWQRGYKVDKFHGLVTEWQEDGAKSNQTTYHNGVRHGLQSSWYPSGARAKEATYRSGLLNGLYTQWYSNAQKKEQGTYKADKKNGVFTYWNENGMKARTVGYKLDQLHGAKTWYSSSTGRKSSEDLYKNGTRYKVTTWHANGKKHEEYGVKGYNTKQGKWKRWREDGTKAFDFTMKNGQKHGKCTKWQENGNKKEEGEWTNGSMGVQGTYTWYYSNGHKEKSIRHKNGHGVYFTSWYENGRKRQEGGRYDNQIRGTYTFWYSNGNKSQVAKYNRSGQKHGSFVDYHENGQKSQEGSYRNDKKHGFWTEWWPNGQTRKEGKYSHGNYNGRWSCWDQWGNHHYSSGYCR